jgi:hypothetical protein
MARVGRKKKPGDRFPSGKLRFETDRGSPELLAHRAVAVHPHLAWSNDDERDELAKRPICEDKRSSYPLGILLLRHEITSGQHYAGRRYMALFVKAVRGVGIPSVLADLAGKGSLSAMNVTAIMESEAVKVATDHRKAYLGAREALDASGRRSAAAVDRWAVFEEGLPPMAMVQLSALSRGLETLRVHFEESDKRAGR